MSAAKLTASQRLTLASSALALALIASMVSCPVVSIGSDLRFLLWFSAESIGVLAMAMLLEDTVRPAIGALLTRWRMPSALQPA